ncbi:hypothetical protein ACRRTK_018977 [Alexandromys fortis]
MGILGHLCYEPVLWLMAHTIKKLWLAYAAFVEQTEFFFLLSFDCVWDRKQQLRT